MIVRKEREGGHYGWRMNVSTVIMKLRINSTWSHFYKQTNKWKNRFAQIATKTG